MISPSIEILKNAPQKPSKITLLFVHGMGQSAWFFAQNFLPWFEVHGVRAQAVSLRGHGLSEGKSKIKWVNLSLFNEDIDLSIGTAEGPVILVGHSMGGYLVQRYLVSRSVHKDKVIAAILMSPVPKAGILGSALQLTYRRPLTALKTILTQSAKHILKNPKNVRYFLHSDKVPASSLTEYIKRFDEESFWAFVQIFIPIRKMPKPLPMLVMEAGKDNLVISSQIKNTAKAYGADHIVIPNAAHQMMVDDTWEITANEMLKWIRFKKLL